MSYQEKNVTVSLFSTIFIMGYFLVNWISMYQQYGLVPARVFSLWGTVIIATILVTIFGSILTNIVLSIVHAIRTRSDQEPRFIEDERDKLISLKGNQVSYITFSLGVLAAMLSFVFGEPALIMFSLIIFFSILVEIAGGISQIIRYRRVA